MDPADWGQPPAARHAGQGHRRDRGSARPPIGGGPKTPADHVAAQAKELKQYPAEVRLPATRREITKTLRNASRMKGDAATGITRKDRRNLR